MLLDVALRAIISRRAVLAAEVAPSQTMRPSELDNLNLAASAKIMTLPVAGVVSLDDGASSQQHASKLRPIVAHRLTAAARQRQTDGSRRIKLGAPLTGAPATNGANLESQL